MRSEQEDKKKSHLPEDFKSANAGDVPQQHNSCDCGELMLLGMDFLARGLTPKFSQSDIPRARRAIASTIIQDGKANNTRAMDEQEVAVEVDHVKHCNDLNVLEKKKNLLNYLGCGLSRALQIKK